VRLGGAIVVLGALVGLLIVAATDQILPASSEYQAQMRLWLAGRATGMSAYLLLTAQIVFGLILSHPVNQSTWKLSRRLYPWHENLWVFVLGFLAAHIVSIILDPYAGVGVAGALIPGLSSYRSVPVALGTLALYGLLIAGLTARYTKLLPPGVWLKLHRASLVVRSDLSERRWHPDPPRAGCASANDPGGRVDDAPRRRDGSPGLVGGCRRLRRERGVVASGAAAAEAGHALGISPHTIRRHVANLSAKIGISGPRALTRYAIDNGIIRER